MMHYKTFRSTGIIPAGKAGGIEARFILTLAHDERHVRRRLLRCSDGNMVMLDLPQAVMLADGDFLVSESGEYFRIRAACELLYEVKARDALHLLALAWHMGNRHLAVEIFPDRITLLRDPVIRTMLSGLGAGVREIIAPFQPLHGAYHDHTHEHHS